MDGQTNTVVVVVEVCYAKYLLVRDSQGNVNAFVEVECCGQRKRTKIKARDLSPTWNERLTFKLNDLDIDEYVEANVYNYNGRKCCKRNFLGKVKIPISSLVREGAQEIKVVAYPLEKRNLFSHVRGELYIKAFLSSCDQVKGVNAKREGGQSEDVKEEEKDKKNGEDEEQHVDINQDYHSKPQNFYLKPEKTQKQEEQGSKKPAVEMKASTIDFGIKETKPRVAAMARKGPTMVQGERPSAYDMVEKMEFLFVKIVKGKGLIGKDLSGSSDPYVNIRLGNITAKTKVVEKSLNPEFNQNFAFAKPQTHTPLLELTVKDKDVLKDDFLGYIAFDVSDIPTRIQPDSPLAPQWYKLEGKHGDHSKNLGEIMVSVWFGTQADEAFPDAWHSDASQSRAKVYLSPKMWYLRVSVIEAQDLVVPSADKSKGPELCAKLQLGFQISKTRFVSSKAGSGTSSPVWNEDLILVAAEPFEDQLVLQVEDKMGANKDEMVGRVAIPVSSVPRRLDHRPVSSRWYNLERHHLTELATKDTKQGGGSSSSKTFMSRIHVRMCLEGGYHVLDESTHYSSDTRPSATQLWKAPIGVLELGILGASGLLPTKAASEGGGRASADAYVVAKYGPKWVRSRTLIDTLAPRWNEQYTWEVYDPCTVLTVGVFSAAGGASGAASKDARVGKVRVRLSTLDADRLYTHSYPLLLLQAGGVKKSGELELALRFSSSSFVNTMACYSQPLLPKMHYVRPLGVGQLETLRATAMKMIALRLSRAEPPLRQEVVQYMLDMGSSMWSMRKSKAHWFRILNVLSGVLAMGRWLNDIREWKNPLTTMLVHLLVFILIWYPELILPTLFLYMFLIGAWHFRFRPRHPQHMDPRLSQAEGAQPDELDEEFDSIPTSRAQDVVKARYDRLRAVSGRIQTVLGDVANQGERLLALLSWRDPRATSLFLIFCLLAATVLYIMPFRMVAILYTLYLVRHPRFRENLPTPHMNFFRRLPTLSDGML